jgi:hypothetical protein
MTLPDIRSPRFEPKRVLFPEPENPLFQGTFGQRIWRSTRLYAAPFIAIWQSPQRSAFLFLFGFILFGMVAAPFMIRGMAPSSRDLSVMQANLVLAQSQIATLEEEATKRELTLKEMSQQNARLVKEQREWVNRLTRTEKGLIEAQERMSNRVDMVARAAGKDREMLLALREKVSSLVTATAVEKQIAAVAAKIDKETNQKLTDLKGEIDKVLQRLSDRSGTEEGVLMPPRGEEDNAIRLIDPKTKLSASFIATAGTEWFLDGKKVERSTILRGKGFSTKITIKVGRVVRIDASSTPKD